MELEQALAIVKVAGYRVTKPKEKAHNGNHGLNALGMPYSANFNPRYHVKYKTPRAPYAASSAANYHTATYEYKAAMKRKHGMLPKHIAELYGD